LDGPVGDGAAWVSGAAVCSCDSEGGVIHGEGWGEVPVPGSGAALFWSGSLFGLPGVRIQGEGCGAGEATPPGSGAPFPPDPVPVLPTSPSAETVGAWVPLPSSVEVDEVESGDSSVCAIQPVAAATEKAMDNDRIADARRPRSSNPLCPLHAFMDLILRRYCRKTILFDQL
jgi:hypothetical protein